MLTMAPRLPSSSTGSVWAIAAAERVSMLNEPIRLTLITNSNVQVERLVVAVDRATGVADAGGVDERTKRTHLRGGGDRSIGVVGGRHITLDEEAPSSEATA